MTKKGIIKFLKSDKTHKKVMDILSEKAEYPIPTAKNTFIAGGCVANTLYSMLHGGEPVIRDIDIFGFEEESGNDQYRWVEPENPDFPNPMEVGLASNQDSYGNRVVRPNGDFSIMLSHTRDGILNKINVHVGSRKKDPNKPFILLQSFDLNACQAGIIDTKIVYTDDFVEFLRGRQLMVTVPINPIQTTMRLRRKLSDLDCYCDIDYEIGLLKHTCLLDTTSKTFGEETYKKYMENQKELNRDFKISKYNNQIKGSWDESRDDDDLDLWMFEPILSEYKLPYKFNHPLEMLNYFRVMSTTTSQSKKKKFQKVIDNIYSGGVYKGDRGDYGRGVPTVTEMKLQIPYDYTKQGSDEIKKLNKQKVHCINHPVWGLLSLSPNYCDCDFDTSHIDYITKFSREHGSLNRLFDVTKGLTIQKHYKLIELIKSISNKRGEWVIGELESLSTSKLEVLTNSKNMGKLINEMIDGVEKELSKELTIPLDLSGFEYSECVTEITNALTLRSEGVKMGHCVGGYSSQIENGSSRIFHIECDGIGSTIQLSESPLYASTWSEHNVNTIKQYGDNFTKELTEDEKHQLTMANSKIKNCGYRKKQHQGRYPEKGNLTPTDGNKSVAEDLIAWINENLNKDKLTESLMERHILEQKLVKLVINRTDSKRIHRDPVVDDMW